MAEPTKETQEPPKETEAPAPPSSEDGGQGDPPPPKDESAEFWRKRAEKAEARQKTLERAQMSEIDRAKAEATEWKTKHEQSEAKLREGELRSAFVSKAKAAGIHDPDAAFVLSDRSKMAMSEDGKLVGADTAIVQLKRDKPYLFDGDGKLGSGGGKGKQQGSGQSISDKMNEEIRRKAYGG